MDLTPPSTPPTPHPNPLADVFSDSPLHIPRLRSRHATAGYRAGISSSKQKHLQQGFDEGYSLGAAFGLKVGWLLGALEKLRVALHSRKPEKAGAGEEADILGQSMEEMRVELTLESIFGKKWWDGEGLWQYEVNTKAETEGQMDAKGNEIVFRDVVDCHPLVRKWSEVIEKELELAGLSWRVFHGEEWEEGRVEG
ncbi:uncharacterized protein KY384_001054 [Bacidia gigantensis]|uniref:uncharacterized protein n=1 Tax=Bacidia gigantensis TaxID=2732470 RepID=UPI001D052ACA|nr:uncharacterized protein KY384_001054 [Bacidia gigantensis]KAG8534210.1 hypothetical protein KY384_001054 [Bacidia gigantensis]